MLTFNIICNDFQYVLDELLSENLSNVYFTLFATLMVKNSNTPYTCVVVDDDLTSTLILGNFITHIPKLKLESTFNDPILAINYIEKTDIDFLFLDIRMKLSGIEVAKKLRLKVRYLIFITAYKEYALDAFKVECDHYLVKPVTFPKFLTTVNQVINKDRTQSKLKDV